MLFCREMNVFLTEVLQPFQDLLNQINYALEKLLFKHASPQEMQFTTEHKSMPTRRANSKPSFDVNLALTVVRL